MLESARKFAAYLDNSQFDEASMLLAEDCRYQHSEGKYMGRTAISSIYKQNHLQMKRVFDEVRYSSEVVPVTRETYHIKLFDTCRLGERWHEAQSLQVITFNLDQLIVEIRHEEVPGQMEAMREFFQAARA